MTDAAAVRKAELRATVLAARAAREPGALTAAEHQIAEHGIAAWHAATTVAAYLSFGPEPPTGMLLDGLAARGVRVVLPVITDSGLDWAQYAGPAAVAPGPLGIAEPTGPRLGASAVAAADVIVVPALAVDRAGHRLGRGRGYYDRAVAAVTAPLVAVVYDEELLDAIPVEPHDRSVDAVLQPRGLTSLSRS